MTRELLISTQNFPPSVGGIQELMGSLTRYLAKAGWRVTVMADGVSDPQDKLFESIGVTILRFAGLKPWRRWRKAFCAFRWLRNRPSAVLVCDSYKSLEKLGKVHSRKLCFVHGAEIPQQPSLSKRRRIIAALGKADIILANSSYTANLLQTLAAGERFNVSVFKLPIDPPPPVDLAIEAAMRGRFGPGPVILGLARLEPRKGFDQVIRSLPALLIRHPDLRLVIAGDGDDRARLSELVEESGVASSVIFTGRVSDAEKHALLRVADIFAMPARREGDSVEGYGLVFLEAAAHGTPAVVGKEGGSADAIIPGETGIVVDGESTASVQAGLADLLGDPVRLADMSAAASKHAESMYWPVRGRVFESLLSA